MAPARRFIRSGLEGSPVSDSGVIGSGATVHSVSLQAKAGGAMSAVCAIVAKGKTEPRSSIA